MRTIYRYWVPAVLLAAVMAAPALAAGRIDVVWIEPLRYSDIGRNAIDRERVLRTLGEHLAQLGQGLPNGQTLSLQVTDIDLAGEVEQISPNPLRILRGRADWPQVSLRYTLAASDGRVLASGEERLADMSYLMRPRDGDLGYEKRLLADWVQARFGRGAP